MSVLSQIIQELRIEIYKGKIVY